MTYSAIRRWLFWLVLLIVVTATFRSLRGYLGQVHVAILYLLLVLIGSSRGGRALGLTLAALCFAFIDYYFQAPYDTLAVGLGVDWVTLFAFLSTATVATNLLVRARNEAAEARRRTDEARALSVLGAETLRHASPEDALTAIVSLIHHELHIARCTLHPWSATRGLGDARNSMIAHDATMLPTVDDTVVVATAERSVAFAVRSTGQPMALAITPTDAVPSSMPDDVWTLLLPLRIEQRVVGVLTIADVKPLTLDAVQRRFVTALAYFAAVAVEREYLAAATAHAAALREANRLKDIVLASVSHDLRTPLTTIKALAQSEAMHGSALGIAIEEQADRLSRLVSDLLEISRLRGHDLPMQIEVNTAEDLIGAVVRQTRGILDGKRMQVSLDDRATTLLGSFDFVHALRSLGNLVENALRFTPLHGVVDISATRKNGLLSISVADRGPGVSMSEREEIFELFYRREGTAADVGHAGMGLAIARQLAEAQGGTVQYAPRAGGGSVFTLQLPSIDVAEPQDERTQEELT